MSSASVTPCTDRDLQFVKSRFAEWFRFNPRLLEDDYLTWQFRSSPARPADDDYDLLLLWRDGKLLGCIGYSWFLFSYEGERRLGAWPHNWINAGPVRSDGLLLLSAFQKRAENRVMMRLSAEAIQVHRLYRVPILERLPRWWAVPDALALRTILADQGSPVAALDWAAIEASSACLRGALGRPRGEELPRVPPDRVFGLDRWASVRSAALRDSAYLNWRYKDAPKHDYRVLIDDDGLAVFRREPIMHSDAHAIRILEWTVDPDRAAGVLTRILDQAGMTGCALVDFHCTAEAIGDSLRPLGFVRDDGPPTALPDWFRPTAWSRGIHVAIDLPPHRRPRQVDFHSWYITAGDSDVDRVKL